MLRDTEYAKELKSVSCIDEDGIHESRLEKLLVKDKAAEEIRLSWWKNGKLQIRPLDLPEAEFALLIAKGIAEGALSPLFLTRVQDELMRMLR